MKIDMSLYLSEIHIDFKPFAGSANKPTVRAKGMTLGISTSLQGKFDICLGNLTPEETTVLREMFMKRVTQKIEEKQPKKVGTKMCPKCSNSTLKQDVLVCPTCGFSESCCDG